MLDSAAPAPHKDGSKKSSGNYEVTVRTSPGDNTATSAHTFLTLYGTTGQSAVPLRQQGQDTDLYTPGTESKFQVIIVVEHLYECLRLGHNSKWHLR